MRNSELMHYGTPRHSGRYPWGSGEDPYQHEEFYSRYKSMHAQGMTDKEIADNMGITTSLLRELRSEASNAERAANIGRAKTLLDKGWSTSAVARELGVNESVIRSWKNEKVLKRAKATDNTADSLKRELSNKKYLDVGSGAELEMGVTRTNLNSALHKLEEEGYEVYNIKVPQATNPGQFTTVKVLAPPGTTWAQVMNNTQDISSITEYTVNNGESFIKLEKPQNLSSDRVMIRYNEEGGIDKDGVIELRRNVNDISLGDVNYAQVRIAVDGTHYLKGMAMYSDDIPDGVDVIFNTNKHVGTPKEEVFKEMKKDPDNPFGATIKANGQTYYDDPNGQFINPKTGNKASISVCNKLKEEGDWDAYSRSLSSQMLSKQNLSLINRQLNMAYDNKEEEFKDICALTNSAVKKKLLQSFADDCDAAAVDLKAAALPRQSSKVILPLTCMKDTEIYAPTYKTGERVVLIRYPHEGVFQIPELTVNNNNKKAKDILGNAIDAVGINSKVAEKLSGADFDGDSVIVIPVNDKVRIKTMSTLEGLKGFDTKEAYGPTSKSVDSNGVEHYYRNGKEYKVLKKSQTGNEMGRISNLITDMTLQGAIPSELARATRHSMTIIDAAKHHLDYKASEEENCIAALREKYQHPEGKKQAGGASTLISRASSEQRVDERKLVTNYSSKNIDPVTGKKIFEETGRTYEKNGKTHKYQTKSTKMYETDDAHTLSSGHPKEEAYANYANRLKALGNSARKEWLATENSDYNPSAAKIYANEVASLNSKLNNAIKNAPRERQAQLYATGVVRAKKKANPGMTDEEKTKLGQQTLAAARVKYGANKKLVSIEITDKEWEAIQSGAISPSKQSKIFNHTDLDTLKQLATPKANNDSIPAYKQSRIKALEAQGFTISEIADACGISTTTVSKYI